MEKISKYLKSSEGQNGQDEVSMVLLPQEMSIDKTGLSAPSGDADSDSGDSIFITQRPVPEAVQPKRQKPPHFTFDVSSCEDPEFCEDEQFKARKKKRKKTYERHKFRLPGFHGFNKTEEQGSMALPPLQNHKLHNYAVGGFFKCVQELLENRQRGQHQLPPLPTIDMDWEHISPISEEEEAALDDGSFRIVGKKQFVVSLKPKISQPWYKPRRNEVRQQTSTAGCASNEKQWSTTWKVKRITLSPDTESSDDGEVQAQTETPQTQKCPKTGEKKTNCNEKETADGVGSDSDATLCRSGLEKCIKKGTEAAVAEAHADISQMGNAECEPERQNLPRGDANNDAPLSETRVKKKGKEDYENGLVGSQEEAAPQVDETPRLSPAASELDSKRREKKRKTKKYSVDDIREEVDGQCDEREVEADAAVSLNEEDSVKKKKEKNISDHVDTENSMADDPQTDDGDVLKKMKKRKLFQKTSDLPQPTTGHSDAVVDCLEITETTESSCVKRKKHKKKQSTFRDDAEVEDVCVDVDCCSDVTTVTGSTDLLVKKKSTSERMHVSSTPQEDESADEALKKIEALEEQDAELVTKKKQKKKKTRETYNMADSGDTASQSDCLASPQKKRKTSSFLVADEKEKVGQTHGEKHACHGGGAEKPDVSISQHQSRQRGGQLDGMGCKKTLSLRNPKEGSKKKRNQRNESEVMSPTEGSESAASVGHFESNDAVVFRKNKKKKQNFKAATVDTESVQSRLKTCSSPPPKMKGKHGPSTEVLNIPLSKDQGTTETLSEHTSLSSSTLGDDTRVKKKKGDMEDGDEPLVQLKSLTETAEIEVYKTRKKQGKKQAADSSFISAAPDTSVNQLETSSLHGIKKNQVKKARRTLHNPSEDFLTD